MQVSVIVITYEPSINKLISTLASIIDQNDVSYEIIIADDGSQMINIDDIQSIVYKAVPNDVPLQFIKNKKNQGTVLNIYSACKCASGEYIKIISPGDLLYDNRVLHDFYVYAKNNPQKSFFFGRAAYYRNSATLELLADSSPSHPNIFNSDSYCVQNIAFMYGQGPVGAAYFCKRDTYTNYIERIINHVIYTEDYSTSVLYILDGGKISFYDRRIVWYEHGLGISTGNTQKWAKLYEEDCRELYLVAKETHSNNQYLEYRFGDKRKRILHPIITLMVIWIKLLSLHRTVGISNTEQQIEYLKNCLRFGERKDY